MNIKTITTVDGVNTVDFGSAASRFYWIENLGSTTVYVSGNENIVPDGDNVKVLSAGCGTMVENLGGKVYILGAGKFQITNQGDKFPPFRNAPVADGGVMASGNPVQIDGLQGGVPFSEMAVSGDDIIGQELTVNVSGKNLIPYPYSSSSGTYNGVTFTVNADGTVTANGTATAQTNFRLSTYKYKAGIKYTISGCPTGGSYSTYKLKAIGDGILGDDLGTSTTFSVSNDIDSYIAILIYAGTVCDNLVFRPQLEIGSNATPYEPYHGSVTAITPDTNPYTISDDIRQQDGLNVVNVSEGEISVTGVRKNAALKKLWDEIDEIKTAIIVSNGESE